MFIRGLGHCPTQVELYELMTKLDRKKTGKISYEEAVSVVLQRKKEEMIEEELMEAFEGLNT